MDFPPAEDPTALQRLRVGLPVYIVAQGFGDILLLGFRQEHVPISADGQVLAVFLLKPSIDPALAVEGVQVVYAVLRGGWRPLYRVIARRQDICSIAGF